MYEIVTFGSFCLKSDNNIFPPKQLKSKKMILLLEYLITYHNKTISQDDLFECLWGESDSSNPISSLKTLIHRTRAALEECGFQHADKIISIQNGSYTFCPDQNYELDFERFEKLHSIIMSADCTGKALLDNCKEAVSIYKGQFLSNSPDEFWVIPISTYYNTLYIDIVNKLINIFKKKDDYTEITELCKNAVTICPFEEDFYYEFTNAVFQSGNCKAALTQFEKTKKFFDENFGVNLSDKFLELHSRILSTQNNTESNINVIEQSLQETKEQKGAFFCEYDFFRRRFQLEVRASHRNKTNLHICLFSLVDKSMHPISANRLTSVMTQLVDKIGNSLRACDIFSRFSASQYIVMLTNTTDANAKMVCNRIQSNCSQVITPHNLLLKCDIKSYNSQDSDTKQPSLL